MKMPPMGAEGDQGTPLEVSRVIVVRTGPVAEVDVQGEVDIATTPDFDHAVQTALDDGASVLVMHLADVTFMGSSGLAGLLKAQRLMREAGGRLVLADPSPAVTELLDMTKLRERFGLEPATPAEGPAAPGLEADGTGAPGGDGARSPA